MHFAYSFLVGVLAGVYSFQLNFFNTSVFAVLLVSWISFFLYQPFRKFYYTGIVLIVVLGFGFGGIRAEHALNSFKESLVFADDTLIDVVGIIVDEADKRETNTKYVVGNIECHQLAGCENVRILVTAQRFPEFKIGDRIHLVGKVRYPEKFQSENGIIFDYPEYLMKDGIGYVMYFAQIEFIESTNYHLIRQRMLKEKMEMIGIINQVIQSPYAELANGMVFGSKQSLGKELLAVFQAAGLTHIIVLSGYNITLVALAVVAVTKVFGKRFSLVAGIVGVMSFSVMVGFSSTVLRASFMAVLALSARVLGLSSSASVTFGIVSGLIILYNPSLILYDPSFQLSCLATFGILHVTDGVKGICRFVPELFGLREVVATTVVAQIAVLPILVEVIGSVSIVGLLVNILVVPFTSLITLLTIALVLLGLINPLLAKTTGFLLYLLLKYVVEVAIIAASLPYAQIPVTFVPVWLVWTLWISFFLILGRFR